MKTHLLLAGLFTAAVGFTSCEDALKEVTVADQTASAAGKKVEGYQAVNIDLVRVEISQEVDENTTRWVALPGVQPGLRNLLASGTVASPLFISNAFPTGTIKQIRLVLGNQSNVKLTDGRTVALDTPSGQTSGLKVKVDGAATAGLNTAVLVSIDPNWQVVARGNGSYNLKPVLEGSLALSWGGDTEAKPGRSTDVLGQAN